MLEKMRVEHKMALEETAARHEAQSMNWLREREALKAQLLGLMKELEETRQVAQQLSFNVGPQLQPIETRQDRRGTAPPGRAAQPRRRVRDVERRDRIRQFQEGEEREHLICKRKWLEVEKRRLDADCMDLQFLERERQRIRFERRRERYGIQRERVELRRQQEQLVPLPLDPVPLIPYRSSVRCRSRSRNCSSMQSASRRRSSTSSQFLLRIRCSAFQ